MRFGRWPSDAETKLTPAERIALQGDIWASIRVGREPAGDYLAFAQGLQSDHNRAVLEDVLGRLNYIGRYLVSDSDRDAYPHVAAPVPGAGHERTGL